MKSRAIKHLVNRKLETMELQAAWDIVSDYVVANTTGANCAFVDRVGRKSGHLNLHTPDGELLNSTKNYRK